MRFWWQRGERAEPRSKVPAPTPGTAASGPDAPSEQDDADTVNEQDRILAAAIPLGRFAWESYEQRGRGLLLFREQDVEDRGILLTEKLEYFTLDDLGEAFHGLLEERVNSYEPEREFVVALFGDALMVRVVEVNTPLAEL